MKKDRSEQFKREAFDIMLDFPLITGQEICEYFLNKYFDISDLEYKSLVQFCKEGRF